MKKLQICAPTLVIVFLLLGGALAADADVLAIESLGERYTVAQAERDVEALTALYTDDAILFNAVGQVLEGREALIAYWQAGFDGPPQHVDIDSRETVVYNDTGHATGTYVVTDDEDQVIVQGYYMAILHRVDGQWLIHRHINNMVLPEPPLPDDEHEGA